MGLGVAQAIANAGKTGRVKVISVDGNKDAFEAVKTGGIDAVVAQFPYVIGAMGVDACKAAAAGKTLPADVKAPVQVVTKANVDAALASAPKPAAPYDEPVRGARQMTTASVTAPRDDDRRAKAPGNPGWRAVLDPANLATWAAPIALVILAIVFQALNPTFLSLGNLTSMLTSSAILIVLAIGQTFVVATAGIDLSIASAMTLAAVIFGIVFDTGLLAAVVAAVVDRAPGRSGQRTDHLAGPDHRLHRHPRHAVGGVGRGADLRRRQAEDHHQRTTAEAVHGHRVDLRLQLPDRDGAGCPRPRGAVPHAVRHLRAGDGRQQRGGGRNRGVDARIKTAVYVIAGLTAGIAAILLVARVGAAEPASNTSFLLNSVAAVVLGGVSLFGGRATIAGPVVGALLLTGLVNGLTLLGVSQFYQPLSVGIVVVAAAFLTRFQK